MIVVMCTFGMLRCVHMAKIDEKKLKEIVKSAILEVFQERRDLVREVLADMIEDLARAFDDEGEITGDLAGVLEGAKPKKVSTSSKTKSKSKKKTVSLKKK